MVFKYVFKLQPDVFCSPIFSQKILGLQGAHGNFGESLIIKILFKLLYILIKKLFKEFFKMYLYFRIYALVFRKFLIE